MCFGFGRMPLSLVRPQQFCTTTTTTRKFPSSRRTTTRRSSSALRVSSSSSRLSSQQRQRNKKSELPSSGSDEGRKRGGNNNVVVHNKRSSSSKKILSKSSSLEPITPLSSAPKEVRARATRALERIRIAEAVGSDASTSEAVLELLSSSTHHTGDWALQQQDDNFASSSSVVVTTPETSSSSSSSSEGRACGRPGSVAGAMNFNTMVKHNEMEAAAVASSSATTTIDENYSTRSEEEEAIPKKKRRGRPRKNSVDDPSSPNQTTSSKATENVVSNNGTVTKMSTKPRKMAEEDDDDDEENTIQSVVEINSRSDKKIVGSQEKKRRKVVKDLPTPKKRTGINARDDDNEEPTTVMRTTIGRQSSSETATAVDASKKKESTQTLQRYFQTELLTREEEYVLGMRVQLMVACEEVHEGLYLELLREPTIAEWAYACGYQEFDPIISSEDYTETDDVRRIRPSKSESNRVEPEPHMFVGSGLATNIGVGRGNGRVRKPPPAKLKDFFDDSAIKFPPKANEGITKGKTTTSSMEQEGMEVVDSETMSQEDILTTDYDDDDDDDAINGEMRKPDPTKPANRGTPSDFVRMMHIGRNAKQRMIQCNMRLVVSISKRYRNVGVNIADLVQEGSIGLSRASEKFQPSRGFKFSTYASWWIQQAVFRSIAYHSRTIRLPVHIHNLLNRVRRIRIALQQDLGRQPTNEEVAQKLGMTVEKYNKMIRLTRRSISLELPKYQNNPKDIGQESEAQIVDTIDSSVLRDGTSPEQSVDQGIFQDDLRSMLKILGETERQVIVARYGLDDGLTRTVTAVAAQMGQSKSWVRSQECRALRKLRRPWYEKRLWEHQNSLTQ